jgi:hypothetical protein
VVATPVQESDIFLFIGVDEGMTSLLQPANAKRHAYRIVLFMLAVFSVSTV